MKIIENCWDDISASHCIFGEHTFSDSVAKVYVESGLAVLSDEMRKQFSMHDQYGEGNCLLVFSGVSKFKITTTPYAKDEKGIVIWGKPIVQECMGTQMEGVREFFIDGSNHDRTATVWGEIVAVSFSLHILD